MQRKLKHYLALGDSYTIGEKVFPQQRWPNKLVQRLVSAGVNISEPTMIAKTGWTSADLLNALNEVNFTTPFDLVTLLIGVNNQYQNLNLEIYRREFNQLLQRAIRYSGDISANVIVLSIPDWSVTPFAADRDRFIIKSQIDRFNRVNQQETQLAGANYIDITPISRRAGTDPTLLSEDHLHPSEIMYAQWVNLIFSTAYHILCNNQEEKYEHIDFK